MEDKFIDIRKVIGEKNPKLLKQLPGFVLNYLEKVIHQNEVNDFMLANKDADGFDFSENVLKYFSIEVDAIGVDHVPKSGGVILACNHPIGGMDAMALIQAIKAHRTDIKFVVNDILLALKNLSDLFVGVNKHGKNSIQSLNEMNKVFSSGGATFVFPAGLVSRKSKGIVEDLEWKKTFITRAKKFNLPIVPVLVDGSLSNFFYRLSNIRQMAGIKANLEMLYLVDEQFKQRDKKVNIYFGEAIKPAALDGSKTDLQWAQEVKGLIYQLNKHSKKE